MNPREELNNAAALQQMKINTRLTSIQSAFELMKTPNYEGKVDHISLLAMAGDIEGYILGGLEDEAKAAIAAASKPKSNIIPVRS